MNDEKLIGFREAARKIGIAHSTLSRQVARGQVRSHGGKVRLSEAIYDRQHNLDRAIWLGRKKSTKPKAAEHSTSRNGAVAAVHSADDGAAHAPAYWSEFAPENVIEFGRMLDINEDLRRDPNIVGSVMALAGVQLIIAELCKLGRRPDDPYTAADDDDPIGPDPNVTFHGEPLNIGLVRKLGRAIMPTDPNEPPFDPNDPVNVGEALLITALDILEEEVKRRRAGKPALTEILNHG